MITRCRARSAWAPARRCSCRLVFCPTAGIRSLELVADGAPGPWRPRHAAAGPLPCAASGARPLRDRGDVHRSRVEEDPGLRSYRSGFWGLAEFGPGGREPAAPRPAGGLDDGAVMEASLGELDPAGVDAASCAPGPAPTAGGHLHGHLRPAAGLLRRQSTRSGRRPQQLGLRDQRRLLDDPTLAASRPRSATIRGSRSRARPAARLLRQLRAGAGSRPGRCRLRRARRPGRRLAPGQVRDALASIGDAQLVYSDARVISPGGELLADTYWSQRRNNHTDIASLLMANSVTGAASLFPRELLDDALPFPPAQFAHFHDHWLALVALALGDIEFVDRPLYDYVQHDGAVLGHAAANRVTGLRDRLGRLGDNPRERIGRWRMHYFVDNQRLAQLTAMLELRCGDRTAPASGGHWRASAAAERSPLALGRLGGARDPGAGAAPPQTLGAEVGLSLAFLWRRLLHVSARGDRPRRMLRLDSVPPPNLAPRPGRKGPDTGSVRTVVDKIAPLELAVRDDAPAAAEPPGAHDRPQAPVRGLHRQVQPGPPAGRAWPPRPDRDGGPRGPAPARLAAAARVLRGPRGPARSVESLSGGSHRASRSTAATASSPRPGGARTSRPPPCARWRPTPSPT